MSTDRFRVLSTSEASELTGLDYFDTEYGWCVVEFPPDNKPRIIGFDGGEPEDQLLVRDWAWVADALNKAYQQGHDDGYETGYENGVYAGTDS